MTTQEHIDDLTGDAGPVIDPETLRTAMRRFASGVTVVTAHHNGESAGITVSAFTSISLEPPIVMVSINTGSSVAPLILESGHFAVHILATEHEPISERFAQQISWEEKLANAPWKVGKSGAPIIDESTTVLDTVLIQSLVMGTHTVMFGRVVDIRMPERVPEAPLLYYDRNYRTLDSIDGES